MAETVKKAVKTAAKKTAAKKAPTKKAAMKVAASHVEIAALAHKFYVERGGQHGSDAEDWLRAEKVLLGK